MSQDPLSLEGVIAPTVTGFDENGSLDPAATAAHARFVVEHGADGVFPLGTNGEFPMLTAEERERVVESVVGAVGDEVPVIAGAGAPGTRETVSHVDRATAAGADGAVVVTPFYYPADARAIRDHYERILDAADVPVYVYHVPGRTGTDLSLSTVEDLAELGAAGIKDSSKDVPWLGQAIDAAPEMTFLAGSDSLLFAGLELGCAGVVSAVANVFPELVVALVAAQRTGDEARARELQSEVYAVRRALKSGPYLAGVKTALELRDVGFDPGPLRDPLRKMAPAERKALEAELETLDLV